MSVAHLLVERAGLFDTIQDSGRIGFQALGMPVAGAMDRIALRLANALVGNPAGTACLEIGVVGPTLRIEADSVRVAVVGPVALDLTTAPGGPATRVDADRSHLLTRGQSLRVGMVEGASTACLAIEGGFALAPFMGSLSTYTRAGVGGFEGRKLRDGDRLPLTLDAARKREERRLPGAFDHGAGPIRVVPGPQTDHFTDAGRAAFFGGEYTVSKEADRMGIRFDGPRIEHSALGPDIVSDGIAAGSIQVPGAGLPIALLSDRQTVGGYPKIATIASVDLPRVGRLPPGTRVRFAAIGVAEAEDLRADQERRLARLLADLPVARPPGGIDLVALYERNLIDGVVWD